MSYWSRDNTRDWINQIENRLEDFYYYLDRTAEWCQQNGVWEARKTLMCSLITCIWVASMRNEQISFTELCELVGVTIDSPVVDKIYNTCEQFQNIELEEILQILILKTTDPDKPYLEI